MLHGHPGACRSEAPLPASGEAQGCARSTLPAGARGRTGCLSASAAPRRARAAGVGGARRERHLVQGARPHAAAGQGLVVREDHGVVLGVGLVAALAHPALVARERAVEAPGTDGGPVTVPRACGARTGRGPCARLDARPSTPLLPGALRLPRGPRQPPALASSASGPASPPHARRPLQLQGWGHTPGPPVPGALQTPAHPFLPSPPQRPPPPQLCPHWLLS